MTIPKHIHQVFLVFDNPVIPNDWIANTNKWKSMHPEYTHTLWDEDACIKLISELVPSFLDVYMNYPHNIQRVDAIRPFILYKHGGVYVDMDTSPRYNITPLLDVYAVPGVEVICAPSANTNTASNWLMASVPESEFWMRTIDEMVVRSKRSYWFYLKRIMHSTGPVLINDMIAAHGDSTVVVMHMDLVNSVNICGTGATNTNYVVDDHGSTWHNPFTKILNDVFCVVTPIRRVPYYYWIALITIGLVLLFLYSRLRQSQTRNGQRP
jgi:mannosyltransferase OCH1-like enzyme